MASSGDKAQPLRPDSPVHVIMVNVTAPATLPAGYEFEAQVEGDPEQTVHAVVVRKCGLHLQHILEYIVIAVDGDRLTCFFVCLYSLMEVLTKEIYSRFPWKAQLPIIHLQERASRRPKAIGRIVYAAASTTGAVTRVCAVQFSAHIVRCMFENVLSRDVQYLILLFPRFVVL